MMMNSKFFITEEEKKQILNLYVLTEQTFKQRWNHIKDFFDNTKCSTEFTDDAKDWKDLYNMLVEKKLIKLNTPILILWGPSQTMYYTKDGKNLIKEMLVSTGGLGFGNTPNNMSTGTGLMQISNKIKANNKFQVLVSKKPINSILGPNKDSTRTQNGEKHTAEVLTGILELEGLEDCNKNIFDRNIYIHGTNREKYLGQRASNGCIRVSNDNILYLLNTIPIGTKLYVRP